MKSDANSEQIRRYVHDELDPAAAAALKRRIEASPELQRELARWLKLRALIADSAAAFDPAFSTRVMGRLRARAGEDWTLALSQLFRRVVVAAAVLTGVLLTFNVATQWDKRAHSSVVEITLAIPPATVANSLEYLDLGL